MCEQRQGIGGFILPVKHKSIVPQQLYLIRAGMGEQLPAPALPPSSSVVSTKKALKTIVFGAFSVFLQLLERFI